MTPRRVKKKKKTPSLLHCDSGPRLCCLLSPYKQHLLSGPLFKHVLFIRTCVFACRYVHECSDCRSQKKASDFLKLEVQAMMSCPVWVPGAKRGSSGRAVCTLNYHLSSLGAHFFLFSLLMDFFKHMFLRSNHHFILLKETFYETL